MSDVSAPQAAPAPTHEVPINQNPPSQPTPLGPQTPSVPPKDPSTKGRNAIQAAFDRASGKQPKVENRTREAPKPAQARMGHNQPPEETKPERSLNLRKRPTEELPASTPSSKPRDRGDHGHFAPNAPPQPQREVQPDQPGPYRRLPEGTPFQDPPGRMSEHAKASWADTPEHVRADVHRQHKEFAQHYQQHQQTTKHLQVLGQAFKPIHKYYEMAKSHGTTLDKALSNYVGLENKLRADPIAGLDTIINNLGLVSPDGQRLGLRDIAYHVLTQSPEQLRQIQQGNAQTAQSNQIGSLHREIRGLKNSLHQMHQQQVFSYTRSGIDDFAETHPRLDELGDIIENEVKLGYDLETAYRRAEMLRPAHAAQTRNTPAQTRPADRSISGAPAATSNGAASRRKEPSRSPREAVAKALRSVGNGNF